MERFFLFLFALVFTTFHFPESVSSQKNILFLLPIATKSHKNVFEPLIGEMYRRRHTVTVVSPFPTLIDGKRVDNLSDIVAGSTLNNLFENALKLRQGGKLALFTAFNTTKLFETCNSVYENPKIKEIMNRRHHYDLIILNGIANDCFSGLIYYLDAPFILLTTIPAPNYVSRRIGMHYPESFLPSPFLAFDDNMSFWERLTNFVFENLLVISSYWYSNKYDQMHREKIHYDIPCVDSIKANASFLFMNSHHVMTFPRPLLPNVIEVGGMHCKEPSPLQNDLNHIMESCEHGVIYFSLGTVVDTEDLPVETVQKFVQVFASLRQTVLWKWNGADIKNVSSNVHLFKWLPQQDILGHPKTKLFITHGGLLSTQETIYHGVPLIGFPVFGDQDLNMKQASRAGYAITLEILDFSVSDLHSAIEEILSNPMYEKTVEKLSRIYKDDMSTSLEKAVFWSEYAMRHDGANHLKTNARKLSYLQYHNLDVQLLLLIAALASIYLTFKLTKCICSKFLGNAGKLILRKKTKMQ